MSEKLSYHDEFVRGESDGLLPKLCGICGEFPVFNLALRPSEDCDFCGGVPFSGNLWTCTLERWIRHLDQIPFDLLVRVTAWQQEKGVFRAQAHT